MNTMKWLLRREFWENKGGIFWTPIVVSGVLVLLLSVALVYGLVVGAFSHAQVNVNGHATDFPSMVQAFASANPLAAAEFSGVVAIPLFVIQAVVVFFYLLDALYDERRNRSILFWKSLPLSDRSTVLSKALTALVVAPLIVIAVSTATALLMMLLVCLVLATQGINLFGAVLLNPVIYLKPVKVLGMLPIYILWALPTVGWLLLVSVWARSKPFLWAVGAPLVLLLSAKWIGFMMGVDTHVEWLAKSVVARLLAGLLPGTWLNDGARMMAGSGHRQSDVAGEFIMSWYTLGTAEMWLGVLVGSAMIYAAIQLRRWKDEG